MNNFNKVNIRSTHPNLYRSLMTFAVINIGLGLNFLFANPTFNPYGIDKMIVGWVFLALGLAKLIFLNFSRNLKIVRFLLTCEVIFMLFWGVGSSITFFQGKTSLQLFVLYTGLSVLELFLLIEPAINPISELKETNEAKPLENNE